MAKTPFQTGIGARVYGLRTRCSQTALPVDASEPVVQQMASGDVEYQHQYHEPKTDKEPPPHVSHHAKRRESDVYRPSQEHPRLAHEEE